MKRAVVVYRSRTGVTEHLAGEIAAYLEERGLEASAESVGDAEPKALADADFVLLGCWTSGLFVVGQHPDEPWMAFVRDLPKLARARVGLFTTYKLATGSMFGRMRAALAGKTNTIGLEIKSRNGRLSQRDRLALERFVA